MKVFSAALLALAATNAAAFAPASKFRIEFRDQDHYDFSTHVANTA